MSTDVRDIQQAAAVMAENAWLLEVGRQAIEAALIDLRDHSISLLHRGNGLVIRYKDGTDSDAIRLGPEHALRIALEAIAKHLAMQEQP